MNPALPMVLAWLSVTAAAGIPPGIAASAAGWRVAAVGRSVHLVAARQPAPPEKEEDAGIPVTSELVKQKCGACHPADAQGRMSRISSRRTTPEGWQDTIRRMVALNKVTLDPADAREIVRYLATFHGLAPEEAVPAAFEVERRMIDYKYDADQDTERTCTRCHSMGRVIAQRRTKQDWALLIAMHRGYYPLVDTQAFRRSGPPPREPGPDGRPPDARHPMDRAIDHLARAFPLVTAEWSAWSATMRAPRLEGRWALVGYAPGRGPVYGEMEIAAAGSPQGSTAEFETRARYVFARSGRMVKRTGRAIVYTGFQWRGRSSALGTSEASRLGIREVQGGREEPRSGTPGGVSDEADLREVMFVDRDWRSARGRWFTGAYDEIGLDVTLHRLGPDGRLAMLTGAAAMVKAGMAGQEVRLYGSNLPATVTPGDLDLGPGITVSRIVSAALDIITVQVDVAAGAAVGSRDVFVRSAEGRATISVYERIEALKVKPQAGLARVGGVVFPKQHAQFEAVAIAYGPDGKPDTRDDIELGLVDATWRLEEYSATYNDDDVKFVGTIDEVTGLFTPNLDGPNPQRSGNRNNVGDVWVVATYVPPGSPPGTKPLRARAQLVVTVPLYMRWDQESVPR